MTLSNGSIEIPLSALVVIASSVSRFKMAVPLLQDRKRCHFTVLTATLIVRFPRLVCQQTLPWQPFKGPRGLHGLACNRLRSALTCSRHTRQLASTKTMVSSESETLERSQCPRTHRRECHHAQQPWPTGSWRRCRYLPRLCHHLRRKYHHRQRRFLAVDLLVALSVCRALRQELQVDRLRFHLTAVKSHFRIECLLNLYDRRSTCDIRLANEI